MQIDLQRTGTQKVIFKVEPNPPSLGPRGGVEIGVVFRGRYAILPQSFALVFCEFPGVFQNLQSLVGVFFASLRFASG